MKRRATDRRKSKWNNEEKRLMRLAEIKMRTEEKREGVPSIPTMERGGIELHPDWQNHRHLNTPKEGKEYSLIEMSLFEMGEKYPELYKVKRRKDLDPPLKLNFTL